MPKLKLKVESILQEYLANRLSDEEFRQAIRLLLDEFQGKTLLLQNIGQLTWRMEQENPDRKAEFTRMWILLDQVSPRIREDLTQRMKQGPARGTR